MFCKILLELCLLMAGIPNFLLGEEKFTATPWRLFYGAGEKRIMCVGVNIFLISWVCSCIMGCGCAHQVGGISDFRFQLKKQLSHISPLLVKRMVII